MELICIDYAENPYETRGYVSGVEELKTRLLNKFINYFEFDLFRDREEIKQQVQELFKEV